VAQDGVRRISAQCRVGFNDGLTANFGLVAGVIGRSVLNQHQAVVVAGMAGLIADALSMGSAATSPARASARV